MEKVIRRALVSVYHKEGLAEILKLLHEQGVEFVSTGGTSTFIEGLGYPCVAVEDLTKYPSMLGGASRPFTPLSRAVSSPAADTRPTKRRSSNTAYPSSTW